MAIISCAECSGKISDTAATCPHCGAPGPKSDTATTMAPQDAVVKKSGGVWKWVLGVPVGLFVLFMGFGAMQPSNPEKTNARRAYEACIDSLATDDRARAGNGRFIAGACESMRNDFIRKYGVNP